MAKEEVMEKFKKVFVEKTGIDSLMKRTNLLMI